MKVLFITSSRLGDAVLSTGLLHHIVQNTPEAKITIGCGGLPKSLFDAVPGVTRVIAIEKKSMNRHWISFWKEVVGTRWDMVIDLRDSAVSRLVVAKHRYIFSSHIDKSRHKVEQNAQVMKLENPPAPHLWHSEEQNKRAAGFISDAKVKTLGIGPTANWIGKTWPAENYIALIAKLTEQGGVMEDARVAVFAAPGEEDTAYQVLNSVAEDKQINVIAKADPGTVAATIARCDLYIGNDSGLMHCAAACGVPTVGLFGPSYPHLYSPWGDHCEMVKTAQSYDELIDFDGYHPSTLTHSLMESLSQDQVLAAVDRCWQKAKSRKS